jgi:hypothetical protein
MENNQLTEKLLELGFTYHPHDLYIFYQEDVSPDEIQFIISERGYRVVVFHEGRFVAYEGPSEEVALAVAEYQVSNIVTM